MVACIEHWRRSHLNWCNGPRQILRMFINVFNCFPMSLICFWVMLFVLHLFFLQPLTFAQFAKCEYRRRGRPLEVTGWDICKVSRFMKHYLQGKGQDSDCGVHAYMFPKGQDATLPLPMPDWVKKREEMTFVEA